MVVGVISETQPTGGSTSGQPPAEAAWFVAGVTERGPVGEAIKLRGPADYTRVFGDPTSYDTVSDQLKTYFAELADVGAVAYVTRLVGPAATTGTRTIRDTAGTPANTLRIDASGPGPWSSRITEQIIAGTDPNTFRLKVFLDGNLVEDEDNLTSPAAAEAAFANSPYVVVTDVGSPTAAPNNNPAVQSTPVAFTTQGADDRVSITDTVRVAALDNFTKDFGTGAVSIPGGTSATIRNGIRAHCIATDRVGITAFTQGASASALIGAAQDQLDLAGAEYLGLFAPWVQVPASGNTTKAIPPDGYVAACRARAITTDGVWRIPAGEIALARYVVAVDSPFDDDTADSLDAGRVSVIRAVDSQVDLYGWRSLSNDEDNYYWLKNRDLLNFIAVEGRSRLLPLPFLNIDSAGHLASDATQDMVGFLDPIADAGGLYPRRALNGSLIDPGYSVDVGPAVNPLSQLQTNKFVVQVAVRPSPAAGLIVLSILEVPLNGAV